METKTLSLDSITIDDTLNVRETLDSDTIERYMENFDQLPPVVVFDATEGDLLADGFHRVEAAKRLGQEDIKANVIQGTRQDAEEHAALANLRHGKPLTRKERRIAVERMLKLRPERANQWIAEDIGCSPTTVAKCREELEAGSQVETLDKLIGKDGKEYPREIKQPSWRDDASPGVIRAVENNVFSKEVAKALAEYPLVQQTDIAWQIEAMSERPPNETLIEAIQEADGVPDNFQQWVDEQIVDDVEDDDEDIDEMDSPTGEQAIEPEPEPESDELFCYDHHVSLDELKEYIGERVDVVCSAGKDKTVERSGDVLGVTEQMGAFMLELRTDLGRKFIQTGTNIGKFGSAGILEIRGRDKSSTGQPSAVSSAESGDLPRQEAIPDKPVEQPDELYCDERFIFLNDIREYVGKDVDVTVSVGRGGGNAQLRGKILDTVDQDGAFMLDFETENGERRQIPTGTARGKPTDAGIVEIRVVEQPQDPTAEEPTEVEVDEVVEEEREAEVTEPVSRRLRDDSTALRGRLPSEKPKDSTAPRKSLLDELREQAKTSLSVPDMEKREVNLPSSFGTDWSGLIASYKNLMNTCEMKEIAQEVLNTPSIQMEFEKIKGFVAVIVSLMKSLTDTEQWI